MNLDVAGVLQSVDITTTSGGGNIFNSGDTIEYTFRDFTQGGFVPTTFYLEMAPDLLLFNDTLQALVASGSAQAPYLENFETNFEARNLWPGWVRSNEIGYEENALVQLRMRLVPAG